jgi:hypothetical protein
MEATKIIEFPIERPKRAAWKRLANQARRRLGLNILWLFYMQWNYGLSFEDITGSSRIWLMSWILYPSYRGVPNPYKSMNHDLITVTSRPAEEWALHEAGKYEAWKQKERIVLSSFHKILMDAEREVMTWQGSSSLKEIEYVGLDGETYVYSYTEIDLEFVYKSIAEWLPSRRVYGVTRLEIVSGLELIESAYAQSEVMGYKVKFTAREQAFRKLAKTA